MIFNSAEFIFFLCVVIVLFYSFPHKWRRYLLLAASYFFYGWWNAKYLILIFSSTITDYYAALKIYKEENGKIRNIWLLLSIFVNLGILFSFKYLNFFADLFHLSKNGEPVLNVLLPVGISFYTFQTMSYTIDVYRKKQLPEKSFFNFALYVSFFPQLVAGPIERAKNILPQLKQKVNFNSVNVTEGLNLILIGFFQKVVVADNLAFFSDAVFNNPASYKGINIFFAALFFAFRIYSDFNGYTNIARGTAMLFGIKLMENFKQPYFAKSMKEFWHRWHISLSTWFRDYVYLSLGGSYKGFLRWIFAILITFMLSGLWHGANLTFLIWGVGHGVVYIIDTLLRKHINFKISKLIFKKIVAFSNMLLTFSITLLLWIFFRANNLEDAKLLFHNLFIPDFNLTFERKWFVFSIFLIFIIILIDLGDLRFPLSKRIKDFSALKQTIIVYFFLLMILFLGNWHNSPFIYFQF